MDPLLVEIEEFFVEQLLSSDSQSATAAVYATVVTHKQAYASNAAFAFANSAIGLEHGVFERSHNTDIIIRRIYKAAALFAVDMFAAETLLNRRITCADVFDIWRQTHDPVFLPAAPTKKEGDRSPPL